MRPQRVALVHDFLNQYGGAEKVLWNLHEMFPDAPIYTSLYIKKNLPNKFKKIKIKTSWMNSFPGIERWYKHLWFLYPLAFSFWQLKGFDLVISSSSTFAKGIGVSSGTIHLCYCHNPMRFVWRKEEYLREERISLWQRMLLEIGIPFLRMWDLKTNRGVTHFVANSENVKKRIKKYYHRNAAVIHPPVEAVFFKRAFPKNRAEDNGYYLVLSRLLGYKRIDLAVAACTQLERPLKVVGTGKHLAHLKSIAGPTVEFLGHASDAQVQALIAGAAAVIVPGEEDFGIVPLEAMAMGKPVIAYGAGGVLESVRALETGVFFKKQSVSDLIDAIEHFETMRFTPSVMRKRAYQFSEIVFKQKLWKLIQHV